MWRPAQKVELQIENGQITRIRLQRGGGFVGTDWFARRNKNFLGSNMNMKQFGGRRKYILSVLNPLYFTRRWGVLFDKRNLLDAKKTWEKFPLPCPFFGTCTMAPWSTSSLMVSYMAIPWFKSTWSSVTRKFEGGVRAFSSILYSFLNISKMMFEQTTCHWDTNLHCLPHPWQIVVRIFGVYQWD